MVAFADSLEIYRTYPHVDMAATGRRTAVQLDALVKGAGGRFKAFRQLPFMIPLTSGCTYSGPSQEIYRQVKLLAQAPGVTGVSFRSEERRVGKECVRTCRYRVAPVH